MCYYDIYLTAVIHCDCASDVTKDFIRILLAHLYSFLLFKNNI